MSHVTVSRENSFDENLQKKNKKRKIGGFYPKPQRLCNGDTKEIMKDEVKKESETLNDSSAGVLFTSSEERKKRLMKISECSEGSSPLHKDWNKDVKVKKEPMEYRPTADVRVKNKQKSRSRDSSNHRTKKHKRNTSDGSITYENDVKKKQTGCGSKKLKRQNSNPGARVPHYGSIKANGWSPSELR